MSGHLNSAGILISTYLSGAFPGANNNSEEILIQNTSLSRNGSTVPSIFGTGGLGIIVPDTSVPNQIRNVVIQKNTAQGNIGDGYFQVDAPNNIVNVVMKDNEADSNTGIGFNIPNSLTLLARNISYNNGDANYSAGVPVINIITGSSAALPVLIDYKPLHNFDLTQS